MLWTVLFDIEQYKGATEEGEKEREMFKTHLILSDSCLYTAINIFVCPNKLRKVVVAPLVCFNIFLLLVFIM